MVLSACTGYLDSNGCLQSIEEEKVRTSGLLLTIILLWEASERIKIRGLCYK